MFFESLLNNHSLGTVLAATFNNLEDSGIQGNTAINMWYKYLYKEFDSRFNFSLGQSVIAISTIEQLKELSKLDPPYLDQYKECIDHDQTKMTCASANLSGI